MLSDVLIIIAEYLNEKKNIGYRSKNSISDVKILSELLI